MSARAFRGLSGDPLGQRVHKVVDGGAGTRTNHRFRIANRCRSIPRKVVEGLLAKTIGSAAVPPPLPRALSTMMRPPDNKCDSELSLPQERVKYVVVGNPEAVVGTSTAFYDLVHALPRRIAREPPNSPRRHSAILSHS